MSRYKKKSRFDKPVDRTIDATVSVSEENDDTAEDAKTAVTSKSPKSRASQKSKAAEASGKLILSRLIKRHLSSGSITMHYEADKLHQLLDMAKVSFRKQSTLVEVACPAIICGDIHGQYGDLMRIFKSCGMPFKKRYVFLGDYVDRGRHPLEVIVLLLALKVQFPKFVFLLRGNHELFHINRVYGFAREIRRRYAIQDAQNLWVKFNETFAEMPLAGLIAGKILCMHGGISPYLNSLDDIRNIKRPIMIATGLALDLLWSDPQTGVEGFQKNKVRGTSFVFGEKTVRDTIKKLGIDMIIRGHQVVEFGYAFFARRKLITVFSASRYNEDLCNFAAAVVVDRAMELSFVQLKPGEYDDDGGDDSEMM